MSNESPCETNPPSPSLMFLLLQVNDFDDSKVTNLNWVVPNDLPVGRYYLEATGLGITGFSQAVDLLGPSSRRRLFHY